MATRCVLMSEKNRDEFFWELQERVERTQGIGKEAPEDGVYYSWEEQQAYYDGVCDVLSMFGLKEDWEKYLGV